MNGASSTFPPCRRGGEQRGWAPARAARVPSDSKVLLFTRDRHFEELTRAALSKTGATIFSARDVRQALDIVCRCGRELDLALMDFDDGCRGMTLLGAIHTCYEQLPVLVITSLDTEHATAVAYANGARACLRKPFRSTALTHAIAELNAPLSQQMAA